MFNIKRLVKKEKIAAIVFTVLVLAMALVAAYILNQSQELNDQYDHIQSTENK